MSSEKVSQREDLIALAATIVDEATAEHARWCVIRKCGTPFDPDEVEQHCMQAMRHAMRCNELYRQLCIWVSGVERLSEYATDLTARFLARESLVCASCGRSDCDDDCKCTCRGVRNGLLLRNAKCVVHGDCICQGETVDRACVVHGAQSN